MIKSELIYYLHAIATHNSLTLAAKNLYMTQPALSIAIKNFEKKLGFLLIKKENNRAILTDDAKNILKLGIPVLKGLNEIELYINNYTSDSTDELIKIVFSNAISSVLGPRIISNLNHFYAAHLPVLFASYASNAEVIDTVLNSSNNIGLLYLQNSDDDFYDLPNFKKIYADKLYLRVNKNTKFFASTTSAITTAEIRNTPLILMHGYAVDSLLSKIKKYNSPNILSYAPNNAVVDSYIHTDLACGVALGFNRSIISEQNGDAIRFIEILDADTTFFVIFSSPDVSPEKCKKIENILRVSLENV